MSLDISDRVAREREAYLAVSTNIHTAMVSLHIHFCQRISQLTKQRTTMERSCIVQSTREQFISPTYSYIHERPGPIQSARTTSRRIEGYQTYNSTKPGFPCPITSSKLSGVSSSTFDASAPTVANASANRERVANLIVVRNVQI